MFDYYTALIVYPISLIVLSFASVIAYRATRIPTALIQAAGFLLVLIGNLFQNFGPTQTSFTENGAIIEYTELFSIGRYLGEVGIVVAALAFLAFAWQIRSSYQARGKAT
jgi:hypothetical protein